MIDERQPTALKGRGAIANPGGRFEPEHRVATDDGWPGDGEDLPPLATTVGVDSSRTVIARNDSPDIPFSQSINPYRGCEHGCVYCYARPTHAYIGLSPGLDFETKLFAKPDAAKQLERELRAPGYKPSAINLGANTDPYQPVERRLRITRGILETLAAFRHPFTIVTKSAMVTRDIDVIAPMARERMAKVFVSVTTLDRDLARTLEPRASTPARRIEAIKLMTQAGIAVGVMTAPMIPGLNDDELESILEAVRDAGAVSASYTLLRLPHEIKDLFADWLKHHAPLRADRVLSLVRDTRGGRLNDPNFGSRFTGQGAYADLLAKRFRVACARLGLNRNDWALDLARFRPPPKPGDQMTLL